MIDSCLSVCYFRDGRLFSHIIYFTVDLENYRGREGQKSYRILCRMLVFLVECLFFGWNVNFFWVES